MQKNEESNNKQQKEQTESINDRNPKKRKSFALPDLGDYVPRKLDLNNTSYAQEYLKKKLAAIHEKIRNNPVYILIFQHFNFIIY